MHNSDIDLINFLNNLLEKAPLKRLSNYIQIKNNKWFNNFLWDNLTSFKLNPPYIPNVKKDQFNLKKDKDSGLVFGTMLTSYLNRYFLIINKESLKYESKFKYEDSQEKNKIDCWITRF